MTGVFLLVTAGGRLNTQMVTRIAKTTTATTWGISGMKMLQTPRLAESAPLTANHKIQLFITQARFLVQHLICVKHLKNATLTQMLKSILM